MMIMSKSQLSLTINFFNNFFFINRKEQIQYDNRRKKFFVFFNTLYAMYNKNIQFYFHQPISNALDVFFMLNYRNTTYNNIMKQELETNNNRY